MALRESCVSAWEVLPVSTDAAMSLTNQIDLGGLRLFGIAIPSEWTTASLTYQVSPDAGTTWFELLDNDGAAVTTGVAASGCSMVDPKLFAPFQYMRIRSGTSSSTVAQVSQRSLKLFLRSS